jgi:hypothetical protein
MPDEYRVTIRLTPEVYALLEARGSRGMPLAAIVREALIDSLTRQPEAATPPDTLAETVAILAASLEDLRQQVAALSSRVERLAAQSRQPAATPRQPRQPSAAKPQQLPTAAPVSDTPSDAAIPPFDPNKFVLGKLCPRGHDYYGTGQTLRRVFRHVCPACDVERTREARKAKQARAE